MSVRSQMPLIMKGTDKIETMSESSEVVMAVLSPVVNELIQYFMARMPLIIPAMHASGTDLLDGY